MAIKPWGMKQRRKSSSQWQSDNDVLEDGEIGFETDTGLAKAGRSGQAWNDLDYLTDWDSGIVNKPDTFPPSEHDHDDRYMLEDDIVDDYYSKDDWNQAVIGAPWDSGRSYAQNQTVSHQERYWVSQVDDNTVEPGTDTNYWEEYKGPVDAQNVYREGDDIIIQPEEGGQAKIYNHSDDSKTPIVESGSNSDGEWTRWADGTQVCLVKSTFSVSSSDWDDLKDVHLYYTTLGPFDYPKTFTSKPGLAFQAAEYFWFRSTSRDWDTEKVKTDIIRENKKSYSDIEIIVTAVGRWK